MRQNHVLPLSHFMWPCFVGHEERKKEFRNLWSETSYRHFYEYKSNHQWYNRNFKVKLFLNTERCYSFPNILKWRACHIIVGIWTLIFHAFYSLRPMVFVFAIRGVSSSFSLLIQVLAYSLFYWLLLIWETGLALLEFKLKVDSDPNGVLENWNADDCDPCMWCGVECLDGKVKTL